MPSKYVLSNMKLMNIRYYFGACLPSVCTFQQLTQIMTLLAPNMRMNFTSIASVESLHKTVDQTLERRLRIGLKTLLTILIASSSYDLIFSRKSFAADKLLRTFSVFTNGRSLLEPRPVDGAFTCLDGIRVISFIQIVFFHTFSTGNPPAVFKVPQSNDGFLVDFIKALPLGCFLAVETFFLLSGFLLSYQFMKSEQNGASFNVIRFYLRRWIRLLPPAFLMQWTYLSYGQYVSGPNTSVLKTVLEHYTVNSIVSLFIGHPYGHLWYVGVEFRLSIVAPVFFLGLKRFGYRFFAVIFPAVIASVFYQLYLYSIHGEATFSARSRCGPWLLGLMLGYFIFRESKRNFMFPKLFSGLISSICIVGLTYLLYWCGSDGQKGVYHTLARVIWTPLMTIQVVLLLKGHLPGLSWILSHPIFQLISKLTFSAYLWHQPMLKLTQAMQRTPVYLNFYFETHRVLAVAVTSLTLAVPWYLLIEAPSLNLEKFKWSSLFRWNQYTALTQRDEC